MKKLSLISFLLFLTFVLKATDRLAVINFDIVGKALTKQQFISITRTEIAKLDTFQVLDKYTVQEVLDENPINLDKCYGVKCLTNIGKKLNVKYVIAGTAELIIDKAIITLRLIDINNEKVIKTSGYPYSTYAFGPGQDFPPTIGIDNPYLTQNSVDILNSYGLS